MTRTRRTKGLEGETTAKPDFDTNPRRGNIVLGKIGGVESKRTRNGSKILVMLALDMSLS